MEARAASAPDPLFGAPAERIAKFGIPENRNGPRVLRAGDAFTFVTDAGDLDILGTPAGTNGFEDLAANAAKLDLDGVVVSVAAIDDLIRMKRASGRARDLAHLEVLLAIRDETDRAGS